MITRERLAAMRGEWMRGLAREGVPLNASIQPFEQLVARYSTPDRAYHNLEHISEMLDVVERLTPIIQGLGEVRLAVWFHDAVYDTRRSDNEVESAGLAREILTPLGVSGRMVGRVAALVRATAHLTSSEAPADADTAALLDADLAILAAAPERYARYASDIRLEYHRVPEADYRRGRAAVLRSFLDRPRIFYHPMTYEGFEQCARGNLADELESLAMRPK